jgi:signal transduction histidine kinase
MNEILRLLRLSLILRVAAGLFGASVFLFNTSDVRVVVFNAIAVLPTLLVLAATFYVARRGPIGMREMRVLLVASIIALAFEAMLGALYFRANFAEVYSEVRRNPSEMETVSPDGDLRRLVRGPLYVPSYFSLILAVLGTWMSQQGWYRWALVAIVANVCAMGAVELLELVDGIGMRLPWGPWLGQSFVLLLMCYFVGSLADLERRRRAEIEAANQRLAEQAGVRERLAASRERVRLARDLHDTLAHSLAGVALQLDAISALASANENVQPEIVRARDAVRRGLSETRAAINDLRATSVEDLGLAAALRRHVELLAPTARAQIHLDVRSDAAAFEPLSVDVADALFRIAQEALHNADRHSNANVIHAMLEHRNGRILLQIEDDGAGFDMNEVRTDRFGMRGMRERAEMIGARLRIDSMLGHGTRVTVEFVEGSRALDRVT